MITRCGRALIEDFLRSRYPSIPIGYCPQIEHNYLLNTCHHRTLASKSIILKNSSVLLLTYESAGSVHFASLNTKSKLTATTPFFDRLLNDSESLISQNHFCLAPLTTPAHIALYAGCYTAPTNKLSWNIRLIAEAGYTTIYLTSVNVKLYGLYDVIKAAGFDYIFDSNGLCLSDSALLTAGIAQIHSLFDAQKPIFLHVHSGNTHIPYLVEPTLEERMRDKSLNDDHQRFLVAIEQTDYIFDQLHKYVKENVNDNLLTIVSSDHGQAFGEHGYWTHGNGVIKEEVNVPLIINHSKLSSKSIHFSTHFDVLPTVLDLLGFEHYYGFGQSLFDENRSSNHCLLWDGKPSRSASTCLGLILDEKKYKLDLIRNTCLESDWNDEYQRELNDHDRNYFEALIGTLAQYRNIMPYMNLNQKLLVDWLNRTKPRILVVTPTIWELDVIQCEYLQDKYEFLITNDDVSDFERPWKKPFYHVDDVLKKVIDQYRNRIDGVLGTGDLYGCLYAAYIAEKLHLPSSTTRSMALISHKYYSRQFQQSIVPEAVPRYDLIDPFSISKPTCLNYPFFVKPVKGTMSMLAQMVHNDHELYKACTLSYRDRYRAWIWYRPLNQLLSTYGLDNVSTLQFIAESPLKGKQVTVEGFVQNGLVTVMGIVDSIFYPDSISFQRFEYPSSLKSDIQTRMIDLICRLISRSDLNSTCFNVELFYDECDDRISIIEINPRMSYQFSDLFWHVDGIGTFEIQLMLTIGKKNIKWIRGNGTNKVAASFAMRRFTDAQVLRVPDQSQIDLAQNRYPGTNVKILCHRGDRLSDNDQDVQSFRYAIVNMAGQTWKSLYEAYEEVEKLLQFEFCPM